MNLSSISDKTLLGKLLRLPLRLIPQNTIVPILQGKLKGTKWIVGSSTQGCWLGSYEYQQRLLFEKMIKERDIVFDIGAHAGFYTLLASLLVGPGGKVFSFEPLPRNLFYLKEHLRLNCIQNVTIIEAAVADFNGMTNFAESPNHWEGHISLQGELKIKAVSLDKLLEKDEISIPNHMKIDVEGAELLVLTGAKSILDNYRPTLFISTHGEKVRMECCSFLESFGYCLKPITGINLREAKNILAYYDK